MENQEKEKVYLFVGSMGPEEFKELVEEKVYSIKKQSEILESVKEVEVLNLENPEMMDVTNGRIGKKENEKVLDFLANEKKREEALQLAIRLEKFTKQNLGKKGKDISFFPEKTIKDATSFSWKEFRSALETLEFFGFVEKDNDGLISFKINEEESDYVLLNNLEEKINNVKFEVEMTKTAIKTKKFNRKFSSLLKRLEGGLRLS